MKSHLWRNQTARADAFVERVVADPVHALLAFDFDGTLSHMKPDPEDVSLASASAEQLQRLGGVVGQVAIISGRSIETIGRLAKVSEEPALAQAIILGQYGIERWDVANDEVREPPIPASVLAAKADLTAVMDGIPGGYLEDKGRAIAAHTRRCPNPEQVLADLEGPVRDIAQRHGMIVEPGRLVWELRSTSIDKGDALRELVAELKPTAVLMAGDDLGDIAAFAVLDELAEMGVATCALVSGSTEQPTLVAHADVLCDGPDGVSAWLRMLADKIGT